MSSQQPSSSPKAQKLEPLDLFSTETVDNLANGFLSVLEPEMVRVQQSLQELTTNQEEMLQSIHDKRMQFEDTTKSTEILNTLQKVPLYKQKLSSLTKQMHGLSKKVKRLQQRANKLKEVRVMREIQRRKDYEKKMEHERMLEARPAK